MVDRILAVALVLAEDVGADADARVEEEASCRHMAVHVVALVGSVQHHSIEDLYGCSWRVATRVEQC